MAIETSGYQCLKTVSTPSSSIKTWPIVNNPALKPAKQFFVHVLGYTTLTVPTGYYQAKGFRDFTLEPSTSNQLSYSWQPSFDDLTQSHTMRIGAVNQFMSIYPDEPIFYKDKIRLQLRIYHQCNVLNLSELNGWKIVNRAISSNYNDAYEISDYLEYEYTASNDTISIPNPPELGTTNAEQIRLFSRYYDETTHQWVGTLPANCQITVSFIKNGVWTRHTYTGNTGEDWSNDTSPLSGAPYGGPYLCVDALNPSKLVVESVWPLIDDVNTGELYIEKKIYRVGYESYPYTCPPYTIPTSGGYSHQYYFKWLKK